MGGFHAFEIYGEPWILERGSYGASESAVELSLYREKAWTSFWLGEGLIGFQTKVAGRGKVVLNTCCPVEEIDLRDEEIAVEGPLVIARSSRRLE